MTIRGEGPLAGDVRATLQQVMKLYDDLMELQSGYFLRHPTCLPLLSYCEARLVAASEDRAWGACERCQVWRTHA